MTDSSLISRAFEPDPATSSMQTFDLPCGVKEEGGGLSRKIVIRELTGHEEDILSTTGGLETDALSAVIERCVLSIGTHRQSDGDWRKIISGLGEVDRSFILVKIRQVSLGELIRFKETCPCDLQIEHDLTVDVNDFKFVAPADPAATTHTGTLPSGATYTCKVKDEQVRARLESLPENSPHKATEILMCRLVEYKGNTALTLEDVKAIPWRDRNALRHRIEAAEGEADMTIDVSCNRCDRKWKTAMNIGNPGFFFPRET